MDPYVIIYYGTLEHRTTTIDNAGKNPEWTNEVFDFYVININDTIRLEVRDEDLATDDLVGESTIVLKELANDDGFDDWFMILNKGKKVGAVRLKVKWFPGQGKVHKKEQISRPQ